jgi:hypothetical protein
MKPKGLPSVAPLAPELRTILCYGPWKVGKTLRDLPPHDQLRARWHDHGAVLTASLHGRRPWFVERDWFVRLLQGEAV